MKINKEMLKVLVFVIFISFLSTFAFGKPFKVWIFLITFVPFSIGTIIIFKEDKKCQKGKKQEPSHLGEYATNTEKSHGGNSK